MASINASTTGVGGIITTADNTGILQLQSAGVTAMTIDASQNITFTNTPSASAMTLLGTITPTVVNSINLSGLTLTSYKSLYIVINNVAITTSKVVYISSNNQQSGGGFNLTNSATAVSGTAWLDLGTGAVGGGTSENTYTAVTSFPVGGLTNVTTASTAIHFRVASTNNFVAGGSIVIYGVR